MKDKTSLAVQWLRLHTSTAGSTGLILGQGTKILHAAWHGQKKKKWKTKISSRKLSGCESFLSLLTPHHKCAGKNDGLILKSYLSQTQRKWSHSLSLLPKIVWWPHELTKGGSFTWGGGLTCPSQGNQLCPLPRKQLGVWFEQSGAFLHWQPRQGRLLEIPLFQKESEKALSSQCRLNGLTKGACFRPNVDPN